jgi:hypothetical protein
MRKTVMMAVVIKMPVATKERVDSRESPQTP